MLYLIPDWLVCWVLFTCEGLINTEISIKHIPQR